ncbi:predicted protein [Plenodomus lingam JN3]|uniref:Predicted protein n=1 Tax=Leptosphaeria maculans (strain JN3 / isolate v23.1.3 / race Av1-4-5-6-7-8) TaxID=985895 RepID=E5ACC3_LEPMJ|nr:predicted protein [Plenodomus lingam JN3]CBY02125.1 predicted protein [Plenodomus lingam JN3]
MMLFKAFFCLALTALGSYALESTLDPQENFPEPVFYFNLTLEEFRTIQGQHLNLAKRTYQNSELDQQCIIRDGALYRWASGNCIRANDRVRRWVCRDIALGRRDDEPQHSQVCPMGTHCATVQKTNYFGATNSYPICEEGKTLEVNNRLQGTDPLVVYDAEVKIDKTIVEMGNMNFDTFQLMASPGQHLTAELNYGTRYQNQLVIPFTSWACIHCVRLGATLKVFHKNNPTRAYLRLTR